VTDKPVAKNQSEASPSIPGQGMDRRVQKARWRYRRPAMIAGGVVAALLAVGLWRLIPPPGSLAVKASDLEIGQVRRAPFQDYLPVRAEVAPLRTVFVSAVSGGQVETVIVLDGTAVAAGAPLATLSNPALKLDVSSKEAEIAGQLSATSGQALALQRDQLDRDKQVSDTSYNLLKAQHDLDVRQQLHDKGYVSDAEVKTFSDAAAYYRDQLKALKGGQQQESGIATAQREQIRQTSARLNASLDVVRSSLDTLTIRAPVAGRLKAGDQLGQIDSEGSYKLIADVDEFYLGRVAPGQRATADIDRLTLPLTVSRVLPQVTNGRFRVELTFDRPPPSPLRRGENVDIRITLGDTRPALVAPNDGWLEAGGGNYAFVLDQAGHRADRRTVAVGRRNPDQVEITAGLRLGERLVTSSYAGFEKSNHLILH
jgi:HlyD family secretion protein